MRDSTIPEEQRPANPGAPESAQEHGQAPPQGLPRMSPRELVADLQSDGPQGLVQDLQDWASESGRLLTPEEFSSMVSPVQNPDGTETLRDADGREVQLLDPGDLSNDESVDQLGGLADGEVLGVVDRGEGPQIAVRTRNTDSDGLDSLTREVPSEEDNEMALEREIRSESSPSNQRPTFRVEERARARGRLLGRPLGN